MCKLNKLLTQELPSCANVLFKSKYHNIILKIHFTVGGVDFSTLLLDDGQIIIAESEDDLQEAVYKLSQTVRKYNLNISSKRTKVMAFATAEPVRAKIILNEKVMEQDGTFRYLGCKMS
jgi:hypothetical protein